MEPTRCEYPALVICFTEETAIICLTKLALDKVEISSWRPFAVIKV